MGNPSPPMLVVGLLVVIAYFALIAFIVRQSPRRAGRIILSLSTALPVLPAVLYALWGRR